METKEFDRLGVWLGKRAFLNTEPHDVLESEWTKQDIFDANYDFLDELFDVAYEAFGEARAALLNTFEEEE